MHSDLTWTSTRNTHTRAHTSTQTEIQTHKQTHTHTHTRACVRMHPPTHVHIHMWAHTRRHTTARMRAHTHTLFHRLLHCARFTANYVVSLSQYITIDNRPRVIAVCRQVFLKFDTNSMPWISFQTRIEYSDLLHSLTVRNWYCAFKLTKWSKLTTASSKVSSSSEFCSTRASSKTSSSESLSCSATSVLSP